MGVNIKSYRKKPVVIEAARVPVYSEYTDIQAYLQDGIDLASWCGGVSHLMNQEDEDPPPHVLIHTLEGDHQGLPGDFIIRGVQGEFYPYKPDIFWATYEEESQDRESSPPTYSQPETMQPRIKEVTQELDDQAAKRSGRTEGE